MGPASDREWLRAALDRSEIETLIDALGTQKPGQRVSDTSTAAIEPICAAIKAVHSGYFPVRLVAFQKSQAKSWQVPWHQDRVIAVQDRHHVDGFTNWSRKGKQWHCEPPLSVLNEMLFVRVFLDDCSEDVGGMVVARGSHTMGKVASDEAALRAGEFEHEVEIASAGDILVLPMLTLHRSSTGQALKTRRVLRFDFARSLLPEPLAWQALT